jgi:isoleucyl-tRNA synthetase
VWIDSGTSWAAVLETQPELRFPSDLYTEGGDQHRGWFHSSLLFSVGLRDMAPYKVVATSGWTLDEQGRAFSKSLGNGVDPVDIAKRLGGEIVRLWVASVDFREDVVASENLMLRVADNYKKLRNTFKFLLGNLYDFDPAQHAVAWDKLEPLDQYMLTRARELVEKISGSDGKGGWYAEFAFHRIYHAVNEFANVDLSKLYADVLKDRLYTFAPNSPARRAAQTVLWKITEALARLVAPILSFLADEVWQYLPADAQRSVSIHTTLFPTADELAPAGQEAFLADWEQLLSIREGAMRSLEEARQEKRIGKALEAKLTLELPAEQLKIAQRYESSLKELFNVSQVKLVTAIGTESRAITTDADGTKCTRCWNYRTDVGIDPRWSTVCGRCASALDEIGFPPLTDEDAA